MAKVTKINHVAVAVHDMQASLSFWRDALELDMMELRDVPAEAARIAFLPVAGSEIELVQPTTGDSGLAKYLEKRGPGLHHLCLEVDDIDSMMARLKGLGVRLINETPKTGADGRRYAFIHPESTSGVLAELYELPLPAVSGFPVLQTERLILREFTEEDIPAVFEMLRREDINQWLETDTMKSIEETAQRVRSRMSLFRNGMGCRWAITLREHPERLIGSCGYFHVRKGTQTMEMGYELHPDYWRQGFMSEALQAVLEFAFHGGALPVVHRMEALVDPRNTPSVRLLEKLGFQMEGVRRHFGFWKGVYVDVLLFALLNTEEISY